MCGSGEHTIQCEVAGRREWRRVVLELPAGPVLKHTKHKPKGEDHDN